MLRPRFCDCLASLLVIGSLASLLVMGIVSASNQFIPTEQLHISYTAHPNSMWITWVAPNASAPSGRPVCYWSSAGSTRRESTATTKTYTDNQPGCRSDHAYGGPCVPWRGLIHSALLTQLPSHSRVEYQCGIEGHLLSAARSFNTPPDAAQDTGMVSFAMLGDQGTQMFNPNGGMEKYNHTYPGAILVRDDILATPSLRFLHLFGDISYANGNQPVWDGYGRDMEPLHSWLPTLMSPGNHDGEFKFGNGYSNAGEGGGDSGIAYAMRYPGPGSELPFHSSHTGTFNSSSMYWAVNSGPVHLIATAGVLDFEPGSEQYAWLEADLAAASTPAAREVRPWIILTNHYPLYCTLTSCNTPASPVNTSQSRSVSSPPPSIKAITPERLRHALEPLLLKYKVDAVFVGHNHNYERTHAVANLSVVSTGRPVEGGVLYEKPGAPIHWVVGSGGADPDALAQWKNTTKQPIAWLATQLYDDPRESTNWGWAQVTANHSCLQVTFNDAYRKQRGLDAVWITK